MLILKRLAVWSIETLCGAVILWSALLLSRGAGAWGVAKFLPFIVSWLLFLSIIRGYAVTTLVCRMVWGVKRLLWYPFIAVLLYTVHAQYFFTVNEVFDLADRRFLRVAGAIVIFVCTFTGSYVLQRWLEVRSEQVVV